jgi:hypothetical protein
MSTAQVVDGSGQVYALLADGTTVEIRPAGPDDYGAWRAAPRGHVPDFADIRAADARTLAHEFLRRAPDGGWLPTVRRPTFWPATEYRWPAAKTLPRPSPRERAAPK